VRTFQKTEGLLQSGYQERHTPHKEVFIMSLKNLFSLGRDREEKPTACGTACGSGDKK